MDTKRLSHIQVLVLTLSTVLLSTVCCAEEQPVQNNPKEKESYSVGYSFGRLIKGQGVAYDLEQLVAGTRDAYGGKGSRISEEEMKSILKELEKKIFISVQKQYQENGVRNQEAGRAFLAENRTKAGVKTLPSGIQYKVLREGTGPSPKAADLVTVHFRGALIDGTEFDSSYRRGEPQSVHVQEVMPAWTEPLQLMQVGSKWQIFVPAELAYGKRPFGRIPSNSTLIFEIELLNIENGVKPDNDDASVTGNPDTKVR